MPNGKFPGPDSGIRASSFLDKDLKSYADSPDFDFTVNRIRSFLESGGVQSVVNLIKLGTLKPSEVKNIIRIYEEDPEQQVFVAQLKEVLHEQIVFERFFEVEREIMSVQEGADLQSLLVSGVKGFDRDTLQSLLMLYEDGRLDPGGCKEKIRTALRFGAMSSNKQELL